MKKTFIVKTMVLIGIAGNGVFSFFTAKYPKVSLRAQSKNSAFFALPWCSLRFTFFSGCQNRYLLSHHPACGTPPLKARPDGLVGRGGDCLAPGFALRGRYRMEHRVGENGDSSPGYSGACSFPGYRRLPLNELRVTSSISTHPKMKKISLLYQGYQAHWLRKRFLS